MKPNIGHINFLIRLFDNNPMELIRGRHVYTTQLIKLKADVSEMIDENERLKRRVKYLESHR